MANGPLSTFAVLDAVGVGFALVATEHLYSFLLSSPFTARNIVQQAGDVEAVQTDLNIALGLGLATNVILAIAFRSWWTALVGGIFGFGLYMIYKTRGEI